jgi:hypothetical protein
MGYHPPVATAPALFSLRHTAMTPGRRPHPPDGAPPGPGPASRSPPQWRCAPTIGTIPAEAQPSIGTWCPIPPTSLRSGARPGSYQDASRPKGRGNHVAATSALPRFSLASASPSGPQAPSCMKATVSTRPPPPCRLEERSWPRASGSGRHPSCSLVFFLLFPGSFLVLHHK